MSPTTLTSPLNALHMKASDSCKIQVKIESMTGKEGK